MGTETTGSLVQGLVHGLSKSAGIHIIGNPDGILTSQISGLASDKVNGQIYMYTDFVGDRWCRLGSVA